MSSSFTLLTRFFQATWALAVLGLSSYLVGQHSKSFSSFAPELVKFFIFISSYSIASIATFIFLHYYAPNMLASRPLIGFSIECINTSAYMGGFIAGAVLLSRATFSDATVRSLVGADVVFAALGYVAWATTAIVSAVGFSKAKGEDLEEVDEKSIASTN